MDFPETLIPSSRQFDPGDWPVKTFKAQNGAEVRILYGSKRTGMTLQLTYDNIRDQDAEQFLDHFNDRKGTFLPFHFSVALPAVRKGWAGSQDALGAGGAGNAWRYAEAPSVVNVRPGRSSVTVNLVGVI